MTLSYLDYINLQSSYLEESPSAFRQVLEGMFGLHLPFILTEPTNPILWLELRELPWPKPPTIRSLRRYVFRVSILIPFLVSIPLLALSASNRVIDFPIYLLTGGIGLLSTLMIPLGDFFYLSAAISRISRDRLSGHLEMVKLTLLPEQEILNAKYAAAQLNSWRALAIELGVRVFTAVVPIGADILLYVHYLAESASLLPISSLFVFLIPTVVSYFLGLFEPCWRMRALTAVGLAISSRTSEHSGNGMFLGFASVAGLHLLQIFVGGLMSALFIRFIMLGAGAFEYSEYRSAIYSVSLAVLSAAFNYLLMRLVRTRALRSALKRLQSDPA